MKKDSLGDRMKKNYEDVHRHILPGHMPTIIRVDGRAFHTVTRGLTKPDMNLENIFNHVALNMCRQISNVKMAYLQSDEISFLMHPYQTFETQPFFDNNIQKIASVTASMATFYFLKVMQEIDGWTLHSATCEGQRNCTCDAGKTHHTISVLNRKMINFDSRVFVVPECEVVNYFLWRQQDTTRNSIQMHAQSMFSQKELDCKGQREMIEMMQKKGLDWHKLDTNLKHGRCAVKLPEVQDGWYIDNNIPIFSKDRGYISKYLTHP